MLQAIACQEPGLDESRIVGPAGLFDLAPQTEPLDDQGLDAFEDLCDGLKQQIFVCQIVIAERTRPAPGIVVFLRIGRRLPRCPCRPMPCSSLSLCAMRAALRP